MVESPWDVERDVCDSVSSPWDEEGSVRDSVESPWDSVERVLAVSFGRSSRDSRVAAWEWVCRTEPALVEAMMARWSRVSAEAFPFPAIT